MELYESIQRLIEVTSFAPDTVLLLFAAAFFVYIVCDAAVFGLVIWAVWHGLDWLLSKLIRK